METVLLSILFALVVAYGVIAAAAPVLSLQLDGVAKRTAEDQIETAIRNRRIAGWGAIVIGMAMATYLLGLLGVVVCLGAAILASGWLMWRD